MQPLPSTAPATAPPPHSPRLTLPGPSLSRQELMFPALAWCGTPLTFSRATYTMLASRCTRWQGGRRQLLSARCTPGPGNSQSIQTGGAMRSTLCTSCPSPPNPAQASRCWPCLHVAALERQAAHKARHLRPPPIIQDAHRQLAARPVQVQRCNGRGLHLRCRAQQIRNSAPGHNAAGSTSREHHCAACRPAARL